MNCKRLITGFSLTLAAVYIGACSTGGSAQKPPGQTSPSATPSQTPTVTVTTVLSQELSRSLRLPGELQPFQDTAIYAKVPGFVEEIKVDRGSVVKKGQLLARLRAPELDTQRSEAEARVRAAESQRVEAASKVNGIRAQRLEAQAKLAADEATYQRLKSASATPGVVAGNDVEVAQRAVEAGRARIQLWNENEKAAQAQVRALGESERAFREAARSSQSMEAYLRLTAPFDGVITERNVHEGSLTSPTGTPMLRLQQVSRLRLVVPVPETDIAGITPGAKINFTVPAFPGEPFSGTLRRISHSLDAKTRTMPVEMDVVNSSGRLAPGMFPEVIWPTRRPRPSLFVPPSAIATTTERTFVIRVREGVAEWVDVRRGASINSKGTDLVEVFGDLGPEDQVAVRGTDELRAGTRVIAKPVAAGK
ncbi:MAG TPA: efflux RND transporter periplasmic adaptor subunit [Blastocatellia bacterium]|nr:efflux RND transporter periplasmic adaptor subunit [Blastocatellia bacterium]